MRFPRGVRAFFATMTGLVIVFLYLPLTMIVVLSFNTATSLSFPTKGFTLKWWRRAADNHGYRRGEDAGNMTEGKNATGWSITTAAGTGAPGYAGDGGKATQAALNNPFDLAVDPAGNLVFSDTFNHCLRRIDAATGLISTVAGTGERGFAGDGDSAIRAICSRRARMWSCQ